MSSRPYPLGFLNAELDAFDAIRGFGEGSGAVRTNSGTMAMHVELERRLAGFKQIEAVVVFQSPREDLAVCPRPALAVNMAQVGRELGVIEGRSTRSMPPLSRAREFFSAYTQDLTSDELGKVFTRDAPEAYRFFTRGIDSKAFRSLPRHTRVLTWTQAFFMAFTMRLSPARRAIYGVALVSAAVGVISLFRGISVFGVPIVIPPFFFRIGVPTLSFAPGTNWLILACAAMNLLVLLEVFDRLSLKRDLEVAREIQLAMLPDGTWSEPGVEASGLTRPANTVGGDFYDILPQPDGRVIVALGDVAGKASPAALLMALFLAMLRTLVDEPMSLPELARRLNIQVSKHAPPSRFITLFLGLFDPRTGDLEFVNAGQTPPLLLRADGTVERLSTGGIALAMFEESTYESGHARLEPGDALVMYSDGVTEAESPAGVMFEEMGLEAAVRATPGVAAAVLSRAVFRAVDHHRQGERLADDLTVLVLSRPIVPPVPPLIPLPQIS